MKTFLKRCVFDNTSQSLQNQNISTVPILHAHRKEAASEDFGIPTCELRAFFARVAKRAGEKSSRLGGSRSGIGEVGDEC